ncbi:MAG: 8-amino-7-oxononanoate synthase [Wenzhouxiangellaceae bacterium]
MRPAIAARLAREQSRRLAADAQRRREVLEPVDAVTLRCNGRRLINFSGNDYLGLAAHPEVARAMAVAADRRVGAGASALVSGYAPEHRELEQALADWLGFEAAVVVATGYQANLALGQTLLGRGDQLLADRLNHASLNDGARLSGARIQRFRHADADDAGRMIGERTCWIASDGVFSMDGDLAPLPALVGLADRHDLGLWLDDAHGLGVLGKTGRGILEHFAVDAGKIDAYVVTFGKALGTQGAAILGDEALIETLTNRARGIIYSTAMAPPLAAATSRALAVLIDEPWRRSRLADNIKRFRQRADHLALSASKSAIQPIIIGDNARALRVSARLAERGLLVRAIRPPTVPEGTARLRITLTAAHQSGHIDQLVDALH